MSIFLIEIRPWPWKIPGHLVFTLDKTDSSTYWNPTPRPDGFTYNVSAFSRTGLSDMDHILDFKIYGQEEMAIDYAIVGSEDAPTMQYA